MAKPRIEFGDWPAQRTPGEALRKWEELQRDIGIARRRLMDAMYPGKVVRKAEPPKPKVPDIQIAPPQPSRRIKFD